MEEKEINIMDIFFYALYKWRVIIILAIVFAIVVGGVAAIGRIRDINDEEKVKFWQTQYEVAYGAYWAKINDLDRQIAENERLASQAQIEIDKLNVKKSDYEGQISDLTADITYYEERIKNYEANIEQLEMELEKLEYYLTYRKEQNEKSLLMAIDPYNVNVYESYIRVDSHYEIIPDSTYQNPDYTAELMQTYRLLVSSTTFYNKMISELELNTEVRYLTEVISVADYNKNSLRIRVISDDINWAKKVGDYVAKAILAEHKHVAQSIVQHDIEEYNTLDYSVVDLSVYNKQYAFIQEAINYEADIRNVNLSILNTEASIRDMNTVIRETRQDIDDINLAISELPLAKQLKENEIKGYKDEIFEFRTEQLELLEKPEPQYQGYTKTSVITGFIKFAIIGGIIGAVLMMVYFAIVGLLSKKICSSSQLCEAVNSEFFGFWPKANTRANARKFAAVDQWIDHVAKNTIKDMPIETAKEIVLSNVAVACDGKSKIMLCGGANKESIATVANAIKEQLPGVDIILGGTIETDPAVVRGITECDGIILVEQLTKSKLNTAQALKDRASTLKKDVLGVITLS